MNREEIIDEFYREKENLLKIARAVKTSCKWIEIPFGFPIVTAKYSIEKDMFISLSYFKGVGNPSLVLPDNTGYFADVEMVTIAIPNGTSQDTTVPYQDKSKPN